MFLIILKAQKIVDKDSSMQKLKAKKESLQMEIKEFYSLLKPLIDKSFPPFWDENNYLLQKKIYNNLMVKKGMIILSLKIWREI